MPMSQYSPALKTINTAQNSNSKNFSKFQNLCCILHQCAIMLFILNLVHQYYNPLIPKSDKHLICPDSITPESNIKVMRIKKMITN